MSDQTTPDTTVNGISRVKTVGTPAVLLADIPLSPGGGVRVAINVAAKSFVGTAGSVFLNAYADADSPLSGAPTVTLTLPSDETNGSGGASGWTGLAASAVLVGGVYHLQVTVAGAASTSINWCGTWRITQV